VKEYWIVLGAESAIEVFRQPGNGRYAQQFVFGLDQVLECAAVPGVRIVISELFA
jgi:Uma2 family endonuclease